MVINFIGNIFDPAGQGKLRTNSKVSCHFFMEVHMELMKVENGKVTSLELVKEINFFRNQDGRWGKANIAHKDLLKVIRDEFDTEIREGNISPSQYDHSMPTGGVKKQPMFELTINQAKQVLVRESKLVRKAVIKRLDELESKLPQLSEMEMISKIAANYVKQDKRIEVLEFKVKNKITLDSGQQSKIKQAVNKKVMERWGLNLNINIGTYLISTAEDRKLKSKLFRNLYKNLYQKFGVPSYRDIKEEEYDLALSFINTWIEDSEVRNG